MAHNYMLTLKQLACRAAVIVMVLLEVFIFMINLVVGNRIYITNWKKKCNKILSVSTVLDPFYYSTIELPRIVEYNI